MKNTITRKFLSAFFTTTLILLFTGTMISFADQKTKNENKSIQGTIVKIVTEKGQIEVKDKAGKIMAFTAGPETDLTIFNKGDQVLIVYGKDQVIQSILKHG